MDQKPDIIMHINGNEIGRYSSPKITLRDGIFTRKLVFKKGKYFQLLDRICERGDLIESMNIVSSTGRTYSIEQFIDKLRYADEIV